jgi:tetratricopeptide (TPR) repeat protein/transglutaminase-like putative cysteine protease
MPFSLKYLLVSVIAFSVVPASRGTEPWDLPFGSDAHTILQAARSISVPDDQSIVVLLEEHRYIIDENGRISSTIRKVYRILKDDAVEDWASVEQEYQPWHENRPDLKARVITEDGATHWLDAKTIADSPSAEYDSNIFSDRRVVRAPLPAAARGAVIEYEVVVRQTSPLLDAGESRLITVFDGILINRFRISIEAAKNISLKTTSKLIPDSAIRRSSGPKIEFECDLGPLGPRKNLEGNLPSDVPDYPYVAFSTGRSWQEVAARYAAVVDQQIRLGNLKALIEGTDRTGNPLAIATRMTAQLHKEIRYTGVEFGESEIIPHTPEETLKRKYGDCKDKASLLVAMLRAVGLKASVALLNAGFGTDVDTEAPGLGVFNHAIVYVAGDHPLWIDATSAETRVGQLPTMDQGRLALVADKETISLVRTPESAPGDNTQTDFVEIHMSDFGPGELRETIEAQGYLETRLRQLYDGNDDKKVKESLERYLKRDFLAKSVGQFSVTKKDDFTEGFRLRLEAKGVKRAFTEEDDAVVVLFPSLVFQGLPFALTGKLRGNAQEEKEEPRRNDFVFNEPRQLEFHYKIFPPVAFKVKDLPSSEELKLGTVEYSRNYRANPDGTIEVTYRFNSGARRISAAEFEKLRDALEVQSSTPTEVITFIAAASELVAMGETAKALKLVSRSTPGDGSVGDVRLARMLVTAGAVQPAVQLAKKIVQKDPASSPGWQALAWAYQHDDFGRPFRGNWSASESEKSYREALKLDPDDFTAKVNLAILLQYNSKGQLFGQGARLGEAIQLYRELVKAMPNPAVEQNLAVSLLYAERYAEARAEIKKLPETEFVTVLSTVLTALTDNSARAIIDSQTSVPDERTRLTILGNASQFLAQLRHYDRALDLLKAASRMPNGGQVQSHLDFMLRMKRHEEALVPETDPLYPVQQALLEMYSPTLNFDALKTLFTHREDWTPLRDGMLRFRRNARTWIAMMELQGLGPDSILDTALSSDLVKTPDAAEDQRGYRISRSSPFATPLVMYVVRESGKLRILGTSENPEAIGQRVLDLLAEKDVKGAQWWLDKVVPDLNSTRSDGTGSAAARYLWSGVTEETRGPESISAAAASMIGPFTGSEMAIRLLKDARTKATVQLVKGQIDLALCASLQKAAKWDDLLVTAKRLAIIHPFEADGFRFILVAATAQGKWKELQVEASQRLKNAPKEMAALEALTLSAIHNGDKETAASSFTRLAELPYAGPEDLQFEAWASLLNGKPDPDVLAKLSKNSELPELSRPDFWYSLGTLQASLNKPEEAQRSLVKALDQEDWDELDATPWVLAGKIYEDYGLQEAAAQAFEKARSSRQTDDLSKWALSLLPSRESKPLDKSKATTK